MERFSVHFLLRGWTASLCTANHQQLADSRKASGSDLLQSTTPCILNMRDNMWVRRYRENIPVYNSLYSLVPGLWSGGHRESNPKALRQSWDRIALCQPWWRESVIFPGKVGYTDTIRRCKDFVAQLRLSTNSGRVSMQKANTLGGCGQKSCSLQGANACNVAMSPETRCKLRLLLSL
jgi:hypothetical protein